MLDEIKRQQKQKVAEKLLESDQFDAFLTILTTVEHDLMERVQRQHDLLGIDGHDDLPSPEDRAAMLRGLCLSKVDGRLPEWWVEHFADIENAEEAAQYVALSEEEWQDQREMWADRYREMGTDGSDNELAEAHVRARHGVTLDTFEEIVVEWSDQREANTLRTIVGAGAEAADEGIAKSNEKLAQLETEGTMADSTSIGLTRPSQVQAFEDAAETVRSDANEGVVDANTWGGTVPDGEVVRVLAEAYTGTLRIRCEVDDDEPG